MRVVVDRNTFVRGVLYEALPDVVEMEDGDAKQLIAMGKAHLAPGEPAQAESPEKAEKLPERVPDLKSLPYPLRAKVAPRKGGGKHG